jgi:hypothetical protein
VGIQDVDVVKAMANEAKERGEREVLKIKSTSRPKRKKTRTVD